MQIDPFIGAIMLTLAFILGALSAPKEEDCPRIIKGYNCRGHQCDHSEAALRRAQLDMALGKEEEEEKHYNFKP